MHQFDIDNVVMINVRSHNLTQLFYISEYFNFNFEKLVNYKNLSGDKPGDFTGKIWIDTKLSILIGVEYIHIFGDFVKRGESMKYIYPKKIETYENYAIGLNELEIMKKIQPIKTPKRPNNLDSFFTYKSLLERGYDIKDSYYESKMVSSKIHYLNNKLSECLEVENYEMAAEIRDQINELKEESSL